MQKVLLVIDGITPDQKAVHYAVELCKSIKADLQVLQIINPLTYGRYLKNMGDRINQARRLVETSMVAATFAEAGEHVIARAIKEQTLKKFDQLVPEPERSSVHCHLSLKSGASDSEIVNYVNDHRDIVLTIYDAPKEETKDTIIEPKTRGTPKRISQRLSTPLVVVKD